ncbi:aspartate-semialdehyde dehydrogenase [Candidatus Daviesbacteria bacterium RIFCSPLOWO2_02_FULL_36_8]|uniref:Aspartate-semialdehyde dehydrogenase n=1 Tax=Candidatus Daviesbacteria bacterium RIFCSPLOWO2_02_FULL_36_8 TaxID=1797793 RepID=A0A1F5MFX4_9BACT|nr:MAG: aspartate-semialdehyde dehydrogenase [Candidatus Daviesbacteria bacterium RIFCSPLOWO2_02_FULL_36_8]
MIRIPVGILGATGMVGQRFITLLKNHPWFEVVCVAASPNSAGKKYREAIKGRWVMDLPIPKNISDLTVLSVEKDMDEIASQVKVVFSALDLDKEKIKEIENGFATLGIAVVSNNSAHRWSKDVPMIMPEINGNHLNLIPVQQKNHKWSNGFVVVKPNCSIQSYVPMLTPLLKFGIKKVIVTTLQAVSGAGKTIKGWPEMQENVIPFIDGEEEKSEKEPMKIWGEIKNGTIVSSKEPVISATCIRVPLEDGHLAAVSISFDKKISKSKIISEWKNFNPLKKMNLPSAPNPFITYMDFANRPQTRIDRNLENGMGISVGRLREDGINAFKFIGLSHNTIRGAAGGAILTAELLKVEGYIK